jgi:hypothetical protein
LSQCGCRNAKSATSEQRGDKLQLHDLSLSPPPLSEASRRSPKETAAQFRRSVQRSSPLL